LRDIDAAQSARMRARLIVGKLSAEPGRGFDQDQIAGDEIILAL
jgi:hypothetical protein